MTHYDDIRTANDAADAEHKQALEDLATSQAEYDQLQAEYEAYKTSHPDAPPTPDPIPDPKPPEPVPTQVLLGCSVHSGEKPPAVVTKFDFYRHFFQPGEMKTAQSWTGEKQLVQAHDTYGCRSYSISFKPDGGGTSATAFGAASITNMNRFLDSIPKDVKPADVYLTYYHEHDGNLKDGSLTLANYKAGSKQVADVAKAHGMQFGPIHNGMVYNGKWGLWPEIWAQNEADVSLYTFWGVDCYSDKYEACSPRMDPIPTYAKSLGLPVLIGEMASPINDAAKQTAWATQARAWALKNTQRASWWSSQVSATTNNYRLTDGAAKAWFGIGATTAATKAAPFDQQWEPGPGTSAGRHWEAGPGSS
jgi:hypothetical protein